MSEFLQSPGFRQLFLSLTAIGVAALNNKLGLNLPAETVGEMLIGAFTASIVSKVANAHVAGKEAAAKIVTLQDAVDSANKSIPSENAITEKKE